MGKNAINHRGQRHVLVIFHVDAYDHLGRPSKLTVGYDDKKFDIQNGTEFFTGFIHESALKGKPSA